MPARQISASVGNRALLPRSGSVHRAVAELIGSRIVRGDYPPGTLLPNEAKWAADFNVSRSAIREAIKILTAKSLLTSRPKVGTRVEPREFWNLLDREVLAWYIRGPTAPRCCVLSSSSVTSSSRKLPHLQPSIEPRSR